MLKIQAKNKNGKNIKFAYDPNTCCLVLDGWHLGGYKKYMQYLPKSKQAVQTVDVNRRCNTPISEVRISFGLECNWNCKYCSQDKSQAHKECRWEMAPGTMATALYKLLHEYGGDFVAVQFWGGEPLLHWDYIKSVHDAFQDLVVIHGGLHSQVHFGFVTNGSLLTSEIVNYCIRNFFSVCISHDGPGQELRTADPLKEHKNLIQRLYNSRQSCSFNSVMTSRNNSHNQLVQHLSKELNTKAQIIIADAAPLAVSDGVDLSLVPFREDLMSYSESLFRDMLTYGILDYFDSYTRIIDDFKRAICSPDLLHVPEFSACGAGWPGKVVLNTHGEAIYCQSYLDEVGTLSELQAGKELSYSKVRHANIAGCKNCPVLHMCRYGCPKQTSEVWEQNCKIRFAHYMALFKIAFLQLTGCIPYHISGDFKFAGVEILSV